jgi:ferrous iron transport protein A
MANALPLNALAPTIGSNGAARVAGDALLSSALAGQRLRIVAISQEDDVAAWLRAVGMHEDAEVTLLRRAPFGGPMHLRTSDGGEFAIHRDLARCIEVVVVHGQAPGDGSNGSAA